MTDQPTPTPEGWMLHDMEFATVVTVEKPGRFIALCDGRSYTREENLVHAELIIADHDAAAERDRVVAENERLRAAISDNLSGLAAIDDSTWHEDTGDLVLQEEAWNSIVAATRELRIALAGGEAVLDEVRKP